MPARFDLQNPVLTRFHLLFPVSAHAGTQLSRTEQIVDQVAHADLEAAPLPVERSQPPTVHAVGLEPEDVLNPRTHLAQLFVMRLVLITQRAVAELSRQLDGLQAEFEIPEVEWQRHLQQMSRLALAIEGNRQVPLMGKALIAGTGVAATKLAASLSVHIRDLVLRAGGRKLLGSGAGVVGKAVGRGLGWWAAAGTAIFEYVDHRRTVHRNEPVLRKSLNGYVDNLGEQLLYDSQCGVIAVLDGVQTEILTAVEDVEGKERE